ncbi:tRNA (mnm(5)s(2)U34)-methyltransferase, chloroplastic [Typha latifolia]|uniref:tRNA (mnm(5)s(2)U34)-methyltransferase, chloroplastic n=1 Tax=Typha latifolia TaxID=4733 RepID=UPI003C2EC2E2
MTSSSLRPSPLRSLLLMETLTLIRPPSRRITSQSPLLPTLPRRFPPRPQLATTARAQTTLSGFETSSAKSDEKSFPMPVSGVEEALMGFITGKRKATEVAHVVWRSIVQKGDIVVDATCGNGHDTLALLKMIADESGKGCVYGIDIQESSIKSTAYMLEKSADAHERKLVKLFSVCHSKIEDIVPNNAPVRLVAFNLGYLPGGDKTIITTSQTTELALQAASRLLGHDGLISIMVYVGHPGGRDELEVVQSFASSLPVETWVSCKFEMLNRPTAPVLVLLYKKQMP